MLGMRSNKRRIGGIGTSTAQAVEEKPKWEQEIEDAEKGETEDLEALLKKQAEEANENSNALPSSETGTTNNKQEVVGAEQPEKPKEKKKEKYDWMDSEDEEEDGDARSQSSRSASPEPELQKKGSSAKEGQPSEIRVVEKTSEDREERTVSVANLNFELSDRDIRHFFQQFGTIEDLLVPRNEGQLFNKGRAIIEYSTIAQAQKAASRSGDLFKNRPIEIQIGLDVASNMQKKAGYHKHKYGGRYQSELLRSNSNSPERRNQRRSPSSDRRSGSSSPQHQQQQQQQQTNKNNNYHQQNNSYQSRRNSSPSRRGALSPQRKNWSPSRRQSRSRSPPTQRTHHSNYQNKGYQQNQYSQGGSSHQSHRGGYNNNNNGNYQNRGYNNNNSNNHGNRGSYNNSGQRH